MRRVLSVILVLAGSAAALGERVERIDGRRVEGDLVSLGADKLVLEVGDEREEIASDEVSRIELGEPDDIMASAGAPVLVTDAGDKLPAAGLVLSDGTLGLDAGLLGDVELPIAAGGVLYQPPPAMTAGEVRKRCEEMRIERVPQDQLVIAKEDGQWLTVAGALKGMTAEKITFRWKDEDRTFDRSLAVAVFFAQGGEDEAPRKGSLVARGGATVGFSDIEIDEAKMAFTSPLLGRVEVPREVIAVVRFNSHRVTRLTEMEPDRIEEYGVFTTFPHRVNASAGGGPLRLDGQTYETGLGLHSHCELTWSLAGRFSEFVAIVGIDDAVRPAGEAVVTFLGDGEPLAEPMTVSGTGEARPVRLDVTGVRRFTVRVEFGPHGLDVADHVDLAEARLIQ